MRGKMKSGGRRYCQHTYTHKPEGPTPCSPRCPWNCARCSPLYRYFQYEAASRYGSNELLVDVAECLADVENAVRQRIFGDGLTTPDLLDQVSLANQAATALDQVNERVEGLWSQFYG